MQASKHMCIESHACLSVFLRSALNVCNALDPMQRKVDGAGNGVSLRREAVRKDVEIARLALAAGIEAPSLVRLHQGVGVGLEPGGPPHGARSRVQIFWVQVRCWATGGYDGSRQNSTRNLSSGWLARRTERGARKAAQSAAEVVAEPRAEKSCRNFEFFR